ncbi:hypothetical protein TIFTF001_031324 [Ficus carica]|uniref:Beta-amyrin synthase n=1 Tax=Ficus carica TaxID=3494 RepID=A0AA88DUU7_FICCA|nr:hypothetical protein TIFTF001_031324 [Ficus carica]
MWRLKIADGGNDPYIFSTNKFVGRQIWEFDPTAGTPEEREEVEAARLNFFNSRHQVKPSSDLLWRMQFLRDKNFKQTIPQVKVEDGKVITFEKTTTTLRRAVHFLSALQASDGHWPAENAGPLFFVPPLNEDGGWGLHIEGKSTMICTALNYVCMRILGEGRPITNGGHENYNACARARQWILEHGSVTYIPSWGKVWLSILGVFDWAGTNPIPPEFWILPSFLPMHPEPLLSRWPLNKFIRERALQVTMKHIHYEDENSRYITLGCVEKHLARIPDYMWVAEDGMKMQSFGSQEWDTTFAIQALLASNLIDEIGETLARGHDFIKKSQVKENPSGDFKSMYRHISKGSWTFSDQDQGWQVSDCTADALKCCLIFSLMPPEIVGKKMELERFYHAVDVLLSLQNKSGGIGAWEPSGAQAWLETLSLSMIMLNALQQQSKL